MDKTSDNPLIVAQSLTRIYKLGATNVVGIQDVDLHIPGGEMVIIKGNSGSGKSTLLALLAGLDQPTGGRLTVAGQDLQQADRGRLNRYRREVVGMVFQTFNLLPTLTVMENVCLPALLAGRPHDEVKTQALEWLQLLHMEARLNHYPGQISGGEMQRTAIARALINKPSVLLADEPTGNLDSRNGMAVIELLAELNRRFKRTIILATHSALADPYATRKICLKDGKVTESSVCDS
jgi:putative ABC transport system ATP-binding protein